MHVAAGPGRSSRDEMSSQEPRSFVLIVPTQQLHMCSISFYCLAKQQRRRTTLETTQLVRTMIRCSKPSQSSQRSWHKDNTEPNKDNWILLPPFPDRIGIKGMAGWATAAIRSLSKAIPAFEGVCLFSPGQANEIIRSDQELAPGPNNVADIFNPEEKLVIEAASLTEARRPGVIAGTAALSLSHRLLCFIHLQARAAPIVIVTTWQKAGIRHGKGPVVTVAIYHLRKVESAAKGGFTKAESSTCRRKLNVKHSDAMPNPHSEAGTHLKCVTVTP